MPIVMDSNYSTTRPLAKYNQTTAVTMLCAGLARRLEPVSRIIAKPAFPLGGRVPIAENWVRTYAKAGIENIAMNLHVVPDSVRGYFGDGKQFLANIRYVEEKEPSGTLGGAIAMLNLLKQSGIRPERVFIPSGDIVSGITPEQLQIMMERHIKTGAAFTIMLAPIPWDRRKDFGTAILDGIAAGTDVPRDTFANVNAFVEKDPNSPSNANNASNYLVETRVLEELEPYLTAALKGVKDPCYDFGQHVLMGMVDKEAKVPHLKGVLEKYRHSLFGYEPGTKWYDVGNKRDYLNVNTAVLNGDFGLDLPYTRRPWGWIGENVLIDYNSVTIHPPVVIGSGCHIFPGAEIGPNAVIGDGWTIYRNAKVRDSVLWPYYTYGSSVGTENPELRERQVREGVVVAGSILVGGIITSDTIEQTVDVLPSGELNVKSIDFVPAGPRA